MHILGQHNVTVPVYLFEVKKPIKEALPFYNMVCAFNVVATPCQGSFIVVIPSFFVSTGRNQEVN